MCSVPCAPTTSKLPSRFAVVFFNDAATAEIYALSLHDALPISFDRTFPIAVFATASSVTLLASATATGLPLPSIVMTRFTPEEHSTALQSERQHVSRTVLASSRLLTSVSALLGPEVYLPSTRICSRPCC